MLYQNGGLLERSPVSLGKQFPTFRKLPVISPSGSCSHGPKFSRSYCLHLQSTSTGPDVSKDPSTFIMSSSPGPDNSINPTAFIFRVKQSWSRRFERFQCLHLHIKHSSANASKDPCAFTFRVQQSRTG